MMKANVETVIAVGDSLFSDRAPLLSMWQDMADNFYVERAHFTRKHNPGRGLAEHLQTSAPALMRKELADAVASMLRPTGRTWFMPTVGDRGEMPQDAKQYVDRIGRTMYRAMYDRAARFTRATKEADNDYVTFGNAVISIEPIMDPQSPHLLYRNWHLRDCAWREDFSGGATEIHRKWDATVNDLIAMFPNTVPDELKALPAEKRNEKVECRHVVMENKDNPRLPWKSIYLCVEHKTILEEVDRPFFGYVIPRWQTVSDSQYGYSPAVVGALPDARMVQDMMRTLIEAGEKAVDPPMLAVQEAIRSDIGLYAGGITWVDPEYDERLGEVLRPITQDKTGIPLGLDMEQQILSQMSSAFMLNKLNMPEVKSHVSAYEVGQRVQEYIRQAMPLFEPVEQEYNGGLCEETNNVLMSVNAFGPPDQLPEFLRDGSMKFQFQSPFTNAEQQEAVRQYQEVFGLTQAHASMDPSIAAELNAVQAYRDAVAGTGAPSTWLATREQAAQKKAEMQQAQEVQEALAMIQQGGEAAKAAGEGGAALAEVAGADG